MLFQAEPWHREYLSRLVETWDKGNAEYFDGALVRPIILLAEPSEPSLFGQTAVVSSYGARSEIRLRPSLLTGTHPRTAAGEEHAEGRFRLVADVLTHETIHQWQQELSGRCEEGYHGHGPAFRDTANVIGARLGLDPVRTCKARGKDKDRPSCSSWPHNVRPDSYYLGAYLPAGVPAGRDIEPSDPCPHCGGTGRIGGGQ